MWLEGATIPIEIPNRELTRSITHRAIPPVGSTGYLRNSLMIWDWKEDSGQVKMLSGTGTAMRQIPVIGKDGRRHNLTGLPLSFRQKDKITFGNRRKSSR